mmetsp:Transcript_28152/g.47593  ORF Transcript_28152/g.47593 Transcript_28152/m.47593 type:complete len:1304 (-) Transcript_28152:1180-5091(-)
MSGGVSPAHFPIPAPATRNVWFLDNDSTCWQEGEIIDTVCNDRNSKNSTWTFYIKTSDGKTASVKATSLSQNEFDFTYVKNRSTCECSKELDTSLFVSEPEVLRFLSMKFKEKQYYYRTGNVTISMNPHGEMEVLDCESYVSKSSFFHLGCNTRGDPHPYEAAEAAFASMVGDKYSLDKRLDQTIFFHGCSGSGKSENMKLVLQYLLTHSMRVLQEVLRADSNSLMHETPRLRRLKSMGASTKSVTFNSSLEGRFAAITNILESLGNACRHHNSNASRFARVVELGYAADCYIEDLSVETFLLETSRVHTQRKHERNFHIFYELAVGASDEFKAECGLVELCDFHYANQSDLYERRDHVSDTIGFKAFCHALNTLKVSLNDQEDFLKCIAAILHLGNICFEEDSEGKVLLNKSPKNNSHIDFVCSLLMIHKEVFLQALCKTSVGSGDDHMSYEDMATAVAARDQLAETIYQLLVQRLLKKYKELQNHDSDTRNRSHSFSSRITIVDIFANECSKTNSFMQFCINYCGERLHAHFVSNIFEKEQDLYLEEGIEWNFVAYTCNNETIKMFEKPETGLLDILESEANIANPSDKKMMHKIYSKVKSSCFHSAHKDKKSHKFVILHYSGAVTYDSHGFTERNRLTRVTADVLDVFRDSSSSLVATLSEDEDQIAEQDQRRRFLSSRIKTSTTILQRQMDSLTKKASLSKQHWVMSFKPSSSNKVGHFNDAFVLDQVIEAGLVPLVALNKKGFAHRMSFQDFVCKFYDLVLLAGKCAITADFLRAREDRDWHTAAIYILGFIHITKEILSQMGINIEDNSADSEFELNPQESVVYAQRSVFIKQAMFEHLEKLSFSIRILMIVKMQRHFRVRFYQRRKLSKSTTKALSITSSCLAYFANVKFCKILNETNARIVLQRFARTALVYLRLKYRNYLIVRVQARVRGHMVRRDLSARKDYAVRLVQYRWKRMVKHKKFLRKWAAVAQFQRRWRTYQKKLHDLVREQTVIRIQRRWRATRKVHRELKRLETVEMNDIENQNAVKKEFLATLDVKLDKDPLYLMNLLKREDEVKRLTHRVEEVKKLALKRCHDLSEVTTKLEESLRENKKLQATVEVTQRKLDSSGQSSGRDTKDLLKVIDQLQKWVADKEISRVKSMDELTATESKVTALMFDTAHHKQGIADAEALLAKKTQEFKDYKFSLVKTSQNAAKVDYDTKTMEFELKTLKDKRDTLTATAAKDLKGLEALKAFSAVLNTRIEANAPEIQLAELNFGLQSLQGGVTKLFSKMNPKERLKAGQNEANLAKAQKKNCP